MKRRFTIAVFVSIAILAVVVLNEAFAARYVYTVTWDANPIEDEVIRYEVVATSETGEIHKANATEPQLKMDISAQTGSVLSFTVQAFNADEKSDLSLPVTYIVPARVPSKPIGLYITHE